VFNAANEEAVAAFLDGRISFRGIVDALEAVLGEAQGWRADPATVEDVLAAEEWARIRAGDLLGDQPRCGREEPQMMRSEA
jgi:1-deoxy-D-xylulose-5-phosphate reductoisomerase